VGPVVRRREGPAPPVAAPVAAVVGPREGVPQVDELPQAAVAVVEVGAAPEASRSRGREPIEP
jgi:ribonuclease PH